MRDVDILMQFDHFTERAVHTVTSLYAFQGFNFRKDCLDAFLVQHLCCHDNLSKLWSVVKSLLILSHGQVTVEKGFSIYRQIVMENMEEASFIIQCSIHNHMLHISGIDALIVSKALLASAGRKYYFKYLG